MSEEKKPENQIFAKIFNHETYGQVLVQREIKDAVTPQITVKANTILGIAEASVNYDSDTSGFQKRDFEFAEITMEDIAGICLKLREQVAEEMSQAVIQ